MIFAGEKAAGRHVRFPLVSGMGRWLSGNVMDDDQRYAAASSKDARFDGVFLIAVRTTRVYCRPSCPAITPKRANVVFYPTAAAAQQSGFRACKRCRPDAAPGPAESNDRADDNEHNMNKNT